MAVSLGRRIRRRRLELGLTQVDAAARAGVSYRTWRRLEVEGKALIDDLMRAAVALRSEQAFARLFSEPFVTSMTALLRQQRQLRVIREIRPVWRCNTLFLALARDGGQAIGFVAPQRRWDAYCAPNPLSQGGLLTVMATP